MTRIANHASPSFIARREDFQGSNLSGEAHMPGSYVYTGHLPAEYADTVGQADYIVFSYSTPIAWHLADGWVVPPASYSVTTAKHQGYARHGAAIDGQRSAAQAPFDAEERLTKTQREALWTLRHYGNVGGRARRTLQALVDAGFARWEDDHIVKP